MKQKPGVMIYFSQVPFLQRMSAEQRGDLFLYIIEYAQHGVVPEIEDPLLGMAWDVMRPAIDLDTERYEARCERNRQNIQKRWEKASDTTVSNRIPISIPKQNQLQLQSQYQSQSQKQERAVIDPSAAEEMLRLAQKRRQEWKAERQRMTET